MITLNFNTITFDNDIFETPINENEIITLNNIDEDLLTSKKEECIVKEIFIKKTNTETNIESIVSNIIGLKAGGYCIKTDYMELVGLKLDKDNFSKCYMEIEND